MGCHACEAKCGIFALTGVQMNVRTGQLSTSVLGLSGGKLLARPRSLLLQSRGELRNSLKVHVYKPFFGEILARNGRKYLNGQWSGDDLTLISTSQWRSGF